MTILCLPIALYVKTAYQRFSLPSFWFPNNKYGMLKFRWAEHCLGHQLVLCENSQFYQTVLENTNRISY